MTIQGWDAPIVAAMERLRTAGALIQQRNRALPEDLRALETAAGEIYAAVAQRAPAESSPELDEVRLLAGSLLMAARHCAIASVSLSDTIDRLAELIGG